MHLLSNGAMHYPWGSPDAIPRFLGSDPSGQPVAEVWIGTHPLNPSALRTGARLAETAGELPFMVKLLAAAQPLSLQVHPSRSQAEEGFAREDAAGIPVDAPERTYRDRNHKPEMVYALSTFDALMGFRPTAEILRVLAPIDSELTRRLADDLRADPGFAGIVRRVKWLLETEHDPEQLRQLVGACEVLVERGLDIKRAYQSVIEVAEWFPEDIGLVVTLMLNRITLQPGEAAFLETGMLHAHLRGLCIEVMATSDNVLRAGLTTKHIDPAGLVACLDAGMARLARVTPDVTDHDTQVFSPPGSGFALAVTQVSYAAADGVDLVSAGRSLVVCTGGDVVLRNETGEKVPLVRGDSAYLGPEDGRVTVHGLGEVAQAYEPGARMQHSRLIQVV